MLAINIFQGFQMVIFGSNYYTIVIPIIPARLMDISNQTLKNFTHPIQLEF